MSAKSVETTLQKLERHLPASVIEAQSEEPVNAKAAKEIQDDYEFSRKSYRDLVEKSNEGIDVLLQLALQSEHPRAFEVLSTMLKNSAEITDKLMELQQKKKDVEAKTTSASAGGGPTHLTQNNNFIGTTKDLQRQLIQSLHSNAAADATSSL